MKHYKYDLYQPNRVSQEYLDHVTNEITSLQEQLQSAKRKLVHKHREMLQHARFTKGSIVTDGSKVYKIVAAELKEDFLLHEHEKDAPEHLYVVEYRMTVLRKNDLQPSVKEKYYVRLREMRLKLFEPRPV